MFRASNLLGITIDKKIMDNLKEENKDLLDFFLKIYELLLDKDIKELDKKIPNIQINQIIGNHISKEKWLSNIENESIKYYGIDIANVKIKDNKIELTSNVRAKLYEYNGCWTVDSYLILEKGKNNYIIKEILI